MATYKKIHKYSKILDILYPSRRRNLCCWDFCGQQICTNFWNRYTSRIRNIKKNIIGTQGRIQFFIAYHEHSKTTVEIIKKAYGRDSKTLGRCSYASGYLIIDDPQESRIADIATARTHLRDGYPDIWELKDRAENECKKKINEIRIIWAEIKTLISTEMEREIEATGTHLILKPSLFTEREYPISCYYNEILSQIVNEIRMRLDNKLPKLLEVRYEFESTGNPANGSLTMCVLSFGKTGVKLCKVKESELNEIKSRVEKLLHDIHLRDKISRALELKDDLFTNEKRKDFFVKIDELWNNIYLESQNLNQNAKCSLCPFKEY
jgi:hypothetical protein